MSEVTHIASRALRAQGAERRGMEEVVDFLLRRVNEASRSVYCSGSWVACEICGERSVKCFGHVLAICLSFCLAYYVVSPSFAKGCLLLAFEFLPHLSGCSWCFGSSCFHFNTI